MHIEYNYIIIFLIYFVLTGCETQPESAGTSEDAEKDVINEHTIGFFNELKEYCGYSFEGETIYPVDKDHLLTTASLEIEFDTCSDSVLRIPFHINDESTRVWIISVTDRGNLKLQHEHLRDDNLADDGNLYGGFADDSGTRYQQRFPADAETIGMYPDAKTNVWSIEIDTLANSLIYDLKRNNEQRFRASFDLSKPS